MPWQSALVCGVIGYALGDLNGRENGPMGAVLGALLGPLGCICAALLPKASGDEKAPPVPDGKAREIARLEAELARLKKPAEKCAAPRADDDGEIPTYKLD